MLPVPDLPVIEMPRKVAGAAPSATPQPVLPPPFAVGDLTRARFLEDRAARMNAYAAARGTRDAGDLPGPEEIKAVLDMAAFYFGHAMLPEGRSVLSALNTVALTPEVAARRNALALGLEVLRPRPGTLPAMAGILLDPIYAGWEDQPLMAALEAIRQGDPARAAPMLPQVTSRLQALPAPLREAVLPPLLEAAIEGRDWRSARDLAGLFQDSPVLKGGTAYHYLLGRAAQDGEAPLAAFDSLVAAAEGDDLWAHKARLALVRLGRDTGTLDPPEALAILEQARQLWRGDAHALDVLEALVENHKLMGDTVAALEVLGTAIAIHADSPRRPAMREEADALVAEFYDAGAEGALSLGTFLAGHRRIAPGFWFEPGFPARAELFAERMLAAGATDIAAGEYEIIEEYLAVSRDLGLIEVDDLRLDDLRLKQAEALFRGGQQDRLGVLLARGLRSTDAERITALDRIRGRHFAATGRSALVLTSMPEAEDVDGIRMEASALFDEGRWQEAMTSYDRLRARADGELRFTDAVRLLLSAHRAGARDYALEFAEAYPALRDLPQWREITSGLLRKVPRVQPLNEGGAKARIDAADQTLEALGAIVPAAN